MCDPMYAAVHASKSDNDDGLIPLNDLAIEEGIKLTVLADIERDEILQQFKEVLEHDNKNYNDCQTTLENKHKSDHAMFDRFVKNTRQEKFVLEEKYCLKCLDLLKLQEEHDVLKALR